MNPIVADISGLYDKEYFNGEGFDHGVSYDTELAKPDIINPVRLKNIERFGEKGRLLDIGCAFGRFLLAAKGLGWTPYGVELSKHAAAHAKKIGLNVKQGTLIDAKFKKDNFDCITMFDVIEHLQNPLSVLEEARRILKKDGLIVIETADVSSLSARIRKDKWTYFLLGHLCYFSRKTLRAMLKKAGFRKVKEYHGDEIPIITRIKENVQRRDTILRKIAVTPTTILVETARKSGINDLSVGGMLFIYKKI